VKLHDVDLVDAAELLDGREEQAVDARLDLARRVPVVVVGRVELVEGVHAVVKAVDDAQGDARTVGERQLAAVHEPALVPPVELGAVLPREVDRVRARRVPQNVVVVRDGDVAAEELAELDEAVAVDRVADDEDGRRVRSAAAQEGDRVGVGAHECGIGEASREGKALGGDALVLV